MTQYCYHLFGLALLDKSVVDDDVFLPRQSIEVRVAVGTSLTAINDIQLVQWELQPLRQPLDTRL